MVRHVRSVGRPRRRVSIVVEHREQGPEIMLIVAPASDRSGIDRLLDLPAAGCLHPTIAAMEFQASRVPWQAGERDQPLCLHFGLRGELFVRKLKDW